MRWMTWRAIFVCPEEEAGAGAGGVVAAEHVAEGELARGGGELARARQEARVAEEARSRWGHVYHARHMSPTPS